MEVSDEPKSVFVTVVDFGKKHRRRSQVLFDALDARRPDRRFAFLLFMTVQTASTRFRALEHLFCQASLDSSGGSAFDTVERLSSTDTPILEMLPRPLGEQNFIAQDTAFIGRNPATFEETLVVSLKIVFDAEDIAGFPTLSDELSCRCFCTFASTYILGTVADQTATVLADNRASNFLRFAQIGILENSDFLRNLFPNNLFH